MGINRSWMAWVQALTVTVPLTSASARQAVGFFPADAALPEEVQQHQEDVQQVVALGRVKELPTPQLFEVFAGIGSECLVVASSVPHIPQVGATVEVRGMLRRVEEADVVIWNALSERTRARLTTRSVLVTSFVIAKPASAMTEPANELVSRVVEVRPHRGPGAIPDQSVPITLRPVMLAHNIEELAGHDVKIVNARVVGVFEPHALLVESATRYEQTLGERDRILVLIDAARLRVPADSIVASTVNVVGVARTLLGAQVTAEVRWPAVLSRERVRRLEVRAAVLATSVQTAEGTELTDRRSAAPPVPRR